MKQYLFGIFMTVLWVAPVFPVGLGADYFDSDLVQKTPRVCIQVDQGFSVDQMPCFDVEIADVPEERLLGLMYRKHLPKDKGMIFVYPAQQNHQFWMKNTLIPLDIIFINQSLRIVRVLESVKPCSSDPCPQYSSQGLAQYVLEVNGGVAAAKRIKAGQKVRLYSIPNKSQK